MAANFKMLVAGNKSKNLRIKLFGDFDGTAAYQVIGAVHKHGKKARSIFIDTSNLRHIYPFGRDILHIDRTGLKNSHAVNLIFSGAHAAELAPKGIGIV